METDERFAEGVRYACTEIKAYIYDMLYDEVAGRFVNSLEKEEFDNLIKGIKERF